ncbi:MAG: DUF2156 domain-containing protein [Bacteroidales bacterium]|nr:DUF2156 domain-containing protein [Bacteroidales bacterium]
MLEFHHLTIADREAYQAVSLGSGRRNCNFTFANLIGWQFWFRTEVCILPDAAVLRFDMEGERAYMLCCAGTPGCDLLQAICDDCGGRLTLLGLEDEAALALQQNACREGIGITVESRRNQYDYIYRRADLASLAGGKLKAKRNHVNKFRAEHPDFEYRPLTPAMFDDCRRLEALWRDEKPHDNPSYGDTIAAEQRVVENVFAHWGRAGHAGRQHLARRPHGGLHLRRARYRRHARRLRREGRPQHRRPLLGHQPAVRRPPAGAVRLLEPRGGYGPRGSAQGQVVVSP